MSLRIAEPPCRATNLSARCGDAALQAAKLGVQLHGGMGFTEEAGMGVYLRTAMQYAAWLGTGSAHRRRFLAAAGDSTTTAAGGLSQ